MKVFNETLKKMTSTSKVTRVVVYISYDAIELGYVNNDDPRLVPGRLKLVDDNYDQYCNINIVMDENNAKFLAFSTRSGYYLITTQFKSESELQVLHEEMMIKGTGGFPYTFKRYYEAMESFNIFDGKQSIVNNQYYSLSNYLKYTFGVEFETSEGYLPEDICFRDGLIPLRDGSITGLEYSTVVLKGNDGINLVKQQMESLAKYTYFNKECALHVHMGGYPIEPKAIFILYQIMCIMENELANVVPQWTFNTARYKESGKDYCKLLPRFSSFNNLYQGIAEQPFYGDLYQPHPHDVERNHKWDCHTR